MNEILKRHERYTNMNDKYMIYRQYILSLRNLSVYSHFGCTFFRCVRVSKSYQSRGDDIIDIIFGISEDGVTFINPITLEIIHKYKMEEILTYGFKSNAFLLVVGTLKSQRRYQFATMRGRQMNELLKQHIELRMNPSNSILNTKHIASLSLPTITSIVTVV